MGLEVLVDILQNMNETILAIELSIKHPQREPLQGLHIVPWLIQGHTNMICSQLAVAEFLDQAHHLIKVVHQLSGHQHTHGIKFIGEGNPGYIPILANHNQLATVQFTVFWGWRGLWKVVLL